MSDVVAYLRAQRELWIELDDPPRRAVCLSMPGWAERARLGSLPRLEFLQALMSRVGQWRGFVHSDAMTGASGEAPLPFSAELWDLLLDDNERWILKVVEAFTLATQKHDTAAEAASGN